MRVTSAGSNRQTDCFPLFQNSEHAPPEPLQPALHPPVRLEALAYCPLLMQAYWVSLAFS